jgi:hypothetical protein
MSSGPLILAKFSSTPTGPTGSAPVNFTADALGNVYGYVEGAIGGAAVPWVVVGPLTAGTYEVAAGQMVICDTRDGNVNLDMPLSAENEGLSIRIINPYAANNMVMLLPNGSPPDTFSGSATDVSITLTSVELTADGISGWWLFW